jgi:hypothetical protein
MEQVDVLYQFIHKRILLRAIKTLSTDAKSTCSFSISRFQPPFQKRNVLLLHGNLADLIPIRHSLFLAGQERMVYRESENDLNLIKRKPERLASVGFKMFP